jgi:hypothetical protein
MFMYFFHLIFHKKLIVSFILVSPLLWTCIVFSVK